MCLDFAGNTPLRGSGGGRKAQRVVPPWHIEICCRPERQQLRLERCPLTAKASPPQGERLREQTVGVKRFSLAGTTVSLCKNKEMGVHIPRRPKAAPRFPRKEPGVHISRGPEGRLKSNIKRNAAGGVPYVLYRIAHWRLVPCPLPKWVVSQIITPSPHSKARL